MTENTVKRPGRPRKADADKRTSKIELRVTAEELERYRQSAGDQPVSEFLRGLADLVIPPEAQEVPSPAPPIECIYFLMLDGACVYVGQTQNLFARLKGHVFRGFDRVLAIPMAEDCRWETEQAYIEALDPEQNHLCGVPDGNYDQKEFPGSFTYRRIAELSGLNVGTIRQYANNGRLDTSSAETITAFIRESRQKRGLPPLNDDDVTTETPETPAIQDTPKTTETHLSHPPSCKCDLCYQRARAKKA